VHYFSHPHGTARKVTVWRQVPPRFPATQCCFAPAFVPLHERRCECAKARVVLGKALPVRLIMVAQFSEFDLHATYIQSDAVHTHLQVYHDNIADLWNWREVACEPFFAWRCTMGGYTPSGLWRSDACRLQRGVLRQAIVASTGDIANPLTTAANRNNSAGRSSTCCREGCACLN
jgi:hypothetical protein